MTPEEELEKIQKSTVNNRTFKSKVIGEFVDEIPIPKDNITENRTSWGVQPGFKEAMMKAMNNPGRAILLVKYDVDKAKSRRHGMAKLRVKALNDQGYTERSGWVLKAVDDSVYAMYIGTEG